VGTGGTDVVSALVARVSEELSARGLRLGIAESCTGGLLAERLTARAGASRFLVAGLVTYSDEAKVRLLGVGSDTLAAHGAVSEPVVREMLDGVRRTTGAEAGAAITGVAGPGGGSPEKPVGSVWVAAAVEGAAAARLFRFAGDRERVRRESVRAALEMLDRLLTRAG
jgi:nicotinamide-nucleotide amidase